MSESSSDNPAVLEWLRYLNEVFPTEEERKFAISYFVELMKTFHQEDEKFTRCDFKITEGFLTRRGPCTRPAAPGSRFCLAHNDSSQNELEENIQQLSVD